MDILILASLNAVFTLLSVFVYRLGYRDGKEEKRAEKPELGVKNEAKPMTEEEKKAAERQRRIDAFRG